MARTPHSIPYCVIAIVRWGILRTMRVPEELIPRVTAAGWHVVAMDSDIVAKPTESLDLQSNPRRIKERIDNATDEGDQWAV